MPKHDIVALGESLVDFILQKNSDKGKLTLEGAAGGAPANVLAAAAKLGRSTAFIGRVGRDPFGDFLAGGMAASGIDTVGLLRGDEPTTLAMVSLDKGGNRSFTFYRNGTADVRLAPDDVDMSLVENCRVFHFGTLSMTDDPTRSATLQAVDRARKAGAAISFDPNYRDFLWAEERDALAAMEEGIALAHYVKVSEEEAAMLSGEADPEKAAVGLLTRFGLRFIAVTLGPGGSVGLTPKGRARQPAYDVKCVDTTGAGDAFWGAALHQLLAHKGSEPPGGESLIRLLQYANAAGSLATAKHGAIPAFADDAAIKALVEKGKPLEL